MGEPRITLRLHTVQRMFQRGITIDEVHRLVLSGRTIEARPDDTPFPVRLVHLQVAGRHLHAVIAEDGSETEIFVITVYEPDPDRWDRTFSHRIP